MSFFEQKKQQFIRWYGGHFVYDRDAENFTFGLHMSRGAIRLHHIVNRVKRWIK